MIYLQKKWIQLSNGKWYLGEEKIEIKRKQKRRTINHENERIFN